MTFLPIALLLAVGSHIVLDDTIEVPPAEWRYVDMVAHQPMMVVNCEFEVVSENTPVRVVWIARADLESFRTGRRERILAATPFGVDGKLRHTSAAALLAEFIQGILWLLTILRSKSPLRLRRESYCVRAR